MLKLLVVVLSRLPLGVLHALADGLIYPLMYYVARYRRRLVRKNLALSFPEKSKSERKAIEKAFYRQFCYTMMESVYGYRCSDEEMRRRVVFENMDEVNRLVDAAGGGIFMLAHMANW